MAELPTGTVTFLFTDLEGSTRLWEQYPEAMKGALAHHDDILRGAVESHGGYVVKTTGDGLHAAFSVAPGAIDAARDAQRALASFEGPDGPLRVRMGVHTGVAAHRDGDYYGTPVNRAARLAAAAHGGQVLVSLATAELVGDDLPEESELTDLGEHRLRDLSRPERVFQLRALGLATAFPPLRTLDAYPTNLPLHLTSFVGRDEVVGKVLKALEYSRLVTLTGVGGVGKTRLATQVAAEMLPRLPDGAWLCELAAANDPDSLVQVVAATLGVQQRPNVSLEGSILEYLRAKDLLIVLDNCEHLLDAASRLAEGALHECPDIRILATSREGLAVEGEQVWPLRSLQVPMGASTEELAVSGAGRLFEERAQAVAPGFAIDGRSATAIAEICRRLDGIPLALELAAARVASMSPTEIESLLDERFRLLTGGRRTAVERHQTLRATVDWSYSLLEPTERLVFDRLGVYAGSFDNAAVSAVVAGEGIERWDVVDAMASLVGKSMVNAEITADDTTRYSMLETLRQYARERLDESGDADAWRRRHAAHYAAFAEDVGPGLVGRDELPARRRISLELDNLRAAVTWALDSPLPDDTELGIAIVAHLAYEASAAVASGIGTWAVRAVPHLEQSTPARRSAVLGAAAYHTHQALGDFMGAREFAQLGAAEGVVELAGAVPTLAYTTLAMSYMTAGQSDEMRRVVADFLRRLDDFDENGYARSAMHSSFATMLRTVGDVSSARSEAEAGMAFARRVQNPTCLALASFALGWAKTIDYPDAALAALDESIDLTRAGALDGAYGAALCLAALLRARRGQVRPAVEELLEAISYSHEAGDHTNFSNAVNRGSEILGLLGHDELAAVFTGIVSGHFLDTSTMYPLFGRELEEHAAVDAQVRARLGVDAYEAATAGGAAMTYAEMVGYLRHELERILAARDGD